MSRDDASPVRNPPERGRNPELGLFQHIREWTDVFPWLRLARTLRLAGSPPLVLLTLLTLGVWWVGESWILGTAMETGGPFELRFVEAVVRTADGTMPWSLFRPSDAPEKWRWWLGTIWTLLIWTPIALVLTRQGALLSVGRPLMGLQSGLRHAVPRMPQAWLTALMPAICIAMMAISIWLLGKLCGLFGNLAPIEIVVAMLVSVIAILAGVLGFGSYFAIPLGWAALAIERDPDPLDSLSRGYEYLLRRPLRLVGYLFLAVGLTFTVGILVSGVAWSALMVVSVSLGGGASSGSLFHRVAVVLTWVPVASVVTLAWGMIGSMYLLLRLDAGEQEVEDIWMPPVDPPTPLPSLPGFDSRSHR